MKRQQLELEPGLKQQQQPCVLSLRDGAAQPLIPVVGMMSTVEVEIGVAVVPRQFL